VLRDHVRVALEDAGLVVGEAADGAHVSTQAAARDPDVVLWAGEGDAQLASAVRKSGAHAGVATGIRTVELVATSRSVWRRVHARGRTRLAAGYALTGPTRRSAGTSRVRRPTGRVSALIPRRARSQLT
jgi:hypothetical protein